MKLRLPLVQANAAEISNGASSWVHISAEKPAWLRAMRPVAIVLCGSAFVAVCARIALPLFFTPVPLSLAPFPVLLLGLLLRPRLAAATLAVYLAEGAMGLPVFGPTAATPSGLAHLIGPTGGYLMAYPLAAALIAFLFRQVPWGKRGFATAALSAAAGALLILLAGAAWLSLLSHLSLIAALQPAVFPFLPGDALKVIAAASLAAGWARLRRVSQ